jgi:hypothetical protein
MHDDMISRRTFIQRASVGVLGVLPVSRLAAADVDKPRTLRFGLIADLHHGYQPDAMKRFETFMQAMHDAGPLDFVIQLGDFCHAVAAEKAVIDLWNTLPVPRYHILGNHDLDFNPSKKRVQEFWGMPDLYYSFDCGPFHFVILDCNFVKEGGRIVDWKKGHGYEGWIHPDQIE